MTAFTSCITYELHAAYLLYTTSPPSHLDGRLLRTEHPISFFRNPGVARRLLRSPAVCRALFWTAAWSSFCSTSDFAIELADMMYLWIYLWYGTWAVALESCPYVNVLRQIWVRIMAGLPTASEVAAIIPVLGPAYARHTPRTSPRHSAGWILVINSGLECCYCGMVAVWRIAQSSTHSLI